MTLHNNVLIKRDNSKDLMLNSMLNYICSSEFESATSINKIFNFNFVVADQDKNTLRLTKYDGSAAMFGRRWIFIFLIAIMWTWLKSHLD